MGGDFAHFLAGAKVDGEGGGLLLEQSGEPCLVLVGAGPAEAGFDRDGEGGRVEGVLIAFYSEIWGLDHSGATASFINVFVGAAKIEVDTREAEAS